MAAELRTSNRSSEHPFDLARDLLCSADAEGRFTSVNAAWEQVLGWSREDLIGRPFIELIHPDDCEATLAMMASVQEAGLELIAFENRYLARDGSWHSLCWSAHTDEGAWFAVAVDVTEDRRVSDGLSDAIAEDRLLVYSQPIADYRSGEIVQEELLVRGRSSTDGRVMLPGEFLPAAELSGAIRTVDHWMLARGLDLAAHGRNVNINLSGRTIADHESMDALTTTVEAAGIAARRVVFEITETAALSNADATRELGERLGRLGCRIALDDFGTGFASLTHLRRLPVQMVKIDSSFVSGLRTEPADRALVRGVAAMARELGLLTVAEGVEDRTTYEILSEFDVDRVQGYLIGRPAPV